MSRVQSRKFYPTSAGFWVGTVQCICAPDKRRGLRCYPREFLGHFRWVCMFKSFLWTAARISRHFKLSYGLHHMTRLHIDEDIASTTAENVIYVPSILNYSVIKFIQKKFINIYV